MRGEQPADLDRQLLAAGVPRRGVPVAPLVEPRRADPQRPAAVACGIPCSALWAAMNRGHRYRPIASSTQRATERLSTSRCIGSSAFSFRSRSSSARSSSLNAAVPSPRGPPLPGAPVAQRALVDPQLPGHLRDRLPGLPHHPHRALLEVLIELPIRSSPSPLLKGDVSTLRGEAHCSRRNPIISARPARQRSSNAAFHASRSRPRSGAHRRQRGVEDMRFAVLDSLETPDPGCARLDAPGRNRGLLMSRWTRAGSRVRRPRGRRGRAQSDSLDGLYRHRGCATHWDAAVSP